MFGRSFFRPQFGPANSFLAPAAMPAGELQTTARFDAYRVLHRLGSTDEGLLEREAKQRLEEYGPNTVAYEVRKNPALRLVELFLTPLSLLLLGLAALSWLTGETGKTRRASYGFPAFLVQVVPLPGEFGQLAHRSGMLRLALIIIGPAVTSI